LLRQEIIRLGAKPFAFPADGIALFDFYLFYGYFNKN